MTFLLINKSINHKYQQIIIVVCDHYAQKKQLVSSF